MKDAKAGDFVYLDPPYDPVSPTSSFTSYSISAFGRAEQERLKALMDDLAARGCRVLQSNSATGFIRALYNDASRYRLIDVEASRAINSIASKRRKIGELLIMNVRDEAD